MHKEKIVGILGGMGPEATVELMQRIIKKTPAAVDNDHIHCIVDQNAKVPNRVLSIQGKIGSAGPVLADMAARLETHGADFLCMPCNTAHYYLPEIKKAISVPFIDMLDSTVAQIKKKFPNETRIGVASTIGTRDTGLYKQRLEAAGLVAVHPQEHVQVNLSDVIAKVKAGDTSLQNREELVTIVTKMREENLKVVLMACTELSVICPENDAYVMDALDCLADQVVAHVKGV